MTITRFTTTMLCAVAMLGMGIPGAEAAPRFERVSTKGQAIVMRISDNGAWAIGQNYPDDSHQNGPGVLVNVAENTYREVNVPADDTGSTINDVTDDGKIVVGSVQNTPAYWNAETGEWTKLPTKGDYCIGSANSVTPDGNYAVGTLAHRENELLEIGVLWDLSTGLMLSTPGLPEKDMTHEDQGQNRFGGISPDGRYILGTMSFSYVMPISTFVYVYDRQAETYDAIGFTPHDTLPWTPKASGLGFISTADMSADGRYVTGSAYMIKGHGSDTMSEEYSVAYLYDVQTKGFSLYDTVNDRGIYGQTVYGDGIILGTTPSNTPIRDWYVRHGNYWYSISDIMKQHYGIDIATKISSENTGTPMTTSADGRVVGVFTDPRGEGYILHLDEDLYDACEGVDLLGNYSMTPTPGSAFSAITSVEVRFDRAVDFIGQPSSAKLYDEQGNQVRQSLSINVDASKATITFRPYEMEAGKSYTVKIPAGTFSMPGDRHMANREIEFSYAGRSQQPVNVVSEYPEEGSSFAKLDPSTSQVILTFDTNIEFTGNETAYLYQAGEDTPLCELYMMRGANMLVLYPLNTRYLFEGTDYRVVLSEGSVADMGLSGANEEFSVNYHGSYVREISSDDKYLFRDDFSTGLSNFLLYEGDHRQPTEEMEMLDFDADNTPWSIALESLESSDYFATSHSQYIPTGQSDDWMVIPQLYIPDEICRLTFQSQSYRKGKTDRLKVYVIPCETTYNTLTADIMNRFKQDAELVYDEVQSPGDNEESVSGEWRDNEIDLAKWAGQSVYIAFVNDNTAQSVVFVDNVNVIHDVRFLAAVNTETTVIGKDEITVSGYVSIDSENAEYGTAALTLADADGNVVSTVSESGLSLKKGDKYDFTFPEALPLAKGRENRFSVNIRLDDEELTIKRSVKNLAFETTRRVVVEEYSGMACGNCPGGILAVENLEHLYGDKVIPVCIRTYNGDPLGSGLDSYSQFLGLNALGAPSGVVDRACPPCGPIVENAGRLSYSGSDEIGHTWLDYVMAEFEILPDMDVNITVNHDDTFNNIEVNGDARFAIDAENLNLGVFTVIVEDNLTTIQSNYYNSLNDPLLGEWGQGGIYGDAYVTTWKAMDVARGVFGTTYNGTFGLLPSTVKGGETYSFTVKGAVPGYVENIKNCKVVVMLIDNNTNRVVNAAMVRMDSTGIGTTTVTPEYSVNVADGEVCVTINGEASASLYGINGALIGTASGNGQLRIDAGGYQGVAALRIAGSDFMATKKIVIK